MAIFTAVNIYIFYNLTITIENKNHERNIKVKIDNVQSVITQLRVKQYEDIRSLICDIKVELMQKYYNPHNIHKLKKKLMEMDESFLYKSYNLNDSSYMFPIIKTIIYTTQNIEKGIKKNIEVNCEPLIEQLTDFLHIVEFYIFGQMLTSSETANYISENKDNIDCSLKCIDDFAKHL